MITLDAFGNPVVGDPDQQICDSVDTLATLRTFVTKPQHGQIVTIRGGAYEGDGLARSYRWVDYATDADDGYNVIKCTAILQGRFYLFVPLSNVQPSNGLVDGQLPSYWASKPFWAIDPVNGVDTAIGWGASVVEAETHPLKTFNRLWLRLAGQQLGEVVISLMGNTDFYGDILTPPSSITMVPTGNNRGGGIQIVGKATRVGSTGTVTGVRIYTDNGNKGKYIVAASGYNFTGKASSGAAAYFIRKVGGGWCAPILTVESSTEISIGRPNSADPYAFFNNGGGVDAVVGNTFEIVTFPLVGNFGASNCRVALSQIFVNSDGYRNLVTSSGSTEVQLKFCTTLPKIYHTGNLYLTGCLFLDHFTATHTTIGATQCSILGNTSGVGHNVQFNVFDGYSGFVDTTLQSGGALDARNQGHIRCSGYTIVQDFTADGGAPGVFQLDESGRMNFDPGPGLVRGRNIAGYLFLAETPNFGGVWGLSSGTFTVTMTAPFDTTTIMWALEVGSPQTMSMADIANIDTAPITWPLRGNGGFWNGYQ